MIYTRERTQIRGMYIYLGEYGGSEMAPQIEVPRIPEPADETDVMREQLEYLIEHAAEGTACGCSDCQRYRRVRAILLEIFDEPVPAKVQTMVPQLAKAA